jgi:dTDP-4-amino-4,6-dideoxygalactose transaminase
MKRLDYVLERRQAVGARYNEALGTLDWVRLPFSSADTPHTYQSYMIQLRPGAPCTRDELMQRMLEAGVATRRGVMAIHLEPYYAKRFPGVKLPVTETAARDTVLLPIYATMTQEEQDYVVEQLARALRS